MDLADPSLSPDPAFAEFNRLVRARRRARFVVDIPDDLHAAIGAAATKTGEAPGEWVRRVIREATEAGT
jgi:hypothetical protein